MEFLEKIISFDFIGMFLAVSACLSAIAGICVFIEKQFHSESAGKVGKFFMKIVGYIKKIIDFLNSFNPKKLK